MTANPAILDTSVLIARESGRRLDVDSLPDETTICVITLAELTAGVLAAPDTAWADQWPDEGSGPW